MLIIRQRNIPIYQGFELHVIEQVIHDGVCVFYFQFSYFCYRKLETRKHFTRTEETLIGEPSFCRLHAMNYRNLVVLLYIMYIWEVRHDTLIKRPGHYYLFSNIFNTSIIRQFGLK